MTHLRMRAMVSFLSFPWNGSDPVSISNCRATQNGSKCSDQPHCPVERPRRTGCARAQVAIQNPGQLCAGAGPHACLEQSRTVGLGIQCRDGWAGDGHGHQLSSTAGSGGQCQDRNLRGQQDMATHLPRGRLRTRPSLAGAVEQLSEEEAGEGREIFQSRSNARMPCGL